MKKLVLTAATLAAFTTTAVAEPSKNAKMSADELRNDMVVSSHSALPSNSMAILVLLAVVVFVLAASGNGYYYTMSDERLKTDIKKVGMKNGLPIYQFRYVGVENHVFEGVLAQDVQKMYPDAVMETEQGYLAVNYDAIGIEVRVIQ